MQLPFNATHEDQWFKDKTMVNNDNPSTNGQPTFISLVTIKKDNKLIAHNIFTVTKNNNQTKAQNIISHIHNENGEDFCPGHITTLATYPIEDIKDLVQETKMISIGFTQHLLNDNDYKIDQTMFIMEASPEFTKTELLEKINENTNPQGTTPIKIIKTIFGLNTQTNNQSIEHILNLPIKETQSPPTETILTKALEEKELIKKFGKSKLTKLAKEINYHGTIINPNPNHNAKS